jgi:hypothetical protein
VETSNPTNSVEIEADLAKAPSSLIEHYLVNVDTHPDVDNKAASLDPEVSQSESITRFLTLPTITTRENPRERDPLVNFVKSIILIYDRYVPIWSN